MPAIKKLLAAMEAGKAPAARASWIRARLAQATGDASAREASLAASRALALPGDADPVDRVALLRLRALDVETTTDPQALPARVQALQDEARGLLRAPDLAPARVTRLSLLLERVQKDLMQRSVSAADPAAKAALAALVESIEGDVEAIFQKALAVPQPELPTYMTYADHLRFRQKRDQCLDLVGKALASPMAERPMSGEVVMGLHTVAAEAALSQTDDPSRFDKAEPHIKALLACSFPRYQGLGHLFQGAIELERSGVAASSSQKAGGAAPPPATASAASQAKMRAGALAHLKVAAAQLPDVAEAQARYGVALILAMEPNLGRQHLQNALRLGNLDPQYQIWAAWSIVQAGYPEEAEPIVAGLLAQVAQGRQPRSMEPTLHLLSGEIHQARRGPAELKRAISEYEKAVAAGQPASTPVQLRLAQIDVQLGQPDRALKRIEMLRQAGLGGPAAEHLAVLILQDQGKAADARKALDRARAAFPRSDELVALDAAMLARAGQPKQADRALADFLAADPENVGLILMRAQLLADLLDDAPAARKLLVNVADRSENSAPMVQLAQLDLRRHDHAAASATIAKIRARWKEAAVADLLDAQLALDQGDTSAAVARFDDALKKDPTNKLVQFWKAQLDSRNGSTEEAARTFEAIVSERPTKELDNGLSLMSAAQSALASLALETGDVDAAIHRFEDLRGAGGLGRRERWQLVAAYSAKGQWPAAKQEMTALLNDPKMPPSADERVRAANIYRMHDEPAAATALLDSVIRDDPTHPAAVVTRAYLLAVAKQYGEASRRLRAAIAAPRKDAREKPPAVFYLMLAAVEYLAPPGRGHPPRPGGRRRGAGRPARRARTDPDQVPPPGELRRRQGRRRLRRGEGQGRPQGPVAPPARRRLPRAEGRRLRLAGPPRPRGREPQGRAGRGRPGPPDGGAGRRCGGAERPRRRGRRQRQGRRADPRLPRPVPQRRDFHPGRLRPRRPPRRPGPRPDDHPRHGQGRPQLPRRPDGPRPPLRRAGRTREEADSYAEALERTPGSPASACCWARPG